ncbi:TPA: hypothetical protein HH820_004856 [Escherichia coli]|nr:hypothetical protein [Escherichia coli]
MRHKNKNSCFGKYECVCPLLREGVFYLALVSGSGFSFCIIVSYAY